MSLNKENHKERLSHRVVKGGFWVFLLRIIHRLFTLVRLIILARILAPYDFGLMGIAMLMMATLETFSQTGFQQALIQKKDNIVSYLNSAWTVLILRGLVLFVILYFIAPYAAFFFKVPEAKSIIQVIGFSILLQAFTNIGVIYFQKELEFNKQFIYQISGTLADFIVAVSTALILRSVWALVFGVLARDFVRCILSYIIHPYKPRLSADFKEAKELFGFGKWILGSSVLIFLITQGDDIFVGKLLGIATLGFYQMAYRIANVPTTAIAHTIHQVTFPAYSKLQDNLPKLRKSYLKVLQLTAFLSFPIAGLIFVLAPEFTKIFLGEKWIPIIPAMRALVLAGLVRSIVVTTGPIFRAIGKPKLGTKWQTVRLCVLVVLIYPFTITWGILGASFAVLLSILVASIGFSVMVLKITRARTKNFIKCIATPLANGIIMALFLFALKAIMPISIKPFFLLVGIGIFVFLSMTYVCDKYINYKMYSLIKESLLLLREKNKYLT